MSTKNAPVLLWVDDDLDDLEVFSQAVQDVQSDARLLQARNGEEALRHLEDAKSGGALPCLIVLDMNMPKVDGRETLVALKTHPDFRHINVIVFTTSCTELDRMFCDRYGVEMFTKPQSYDTVKELVGKFLDICLR